MGTHYSDRSVECFGVNRSYLMMELKPAVDMFSMHLSLRRSTSRAACQAAGSSTARAFKFIISLVVGKKLEVYHEDNVRKPHN